MTRATVNVGEGIGFLPGTEEEKMAPWMGALDDNLEFLTQGAGSAAGDWGRAATGDLIQSHQDQEHELHARPHLPQPLGHH